MNLNKDFENVYFLKRLKKLFKQEEKKIFC